ncbi:DUF7684 family protein [Sphingomonas azotifigens]|uniref:DUF7684 family protein n=1 Tax=Sphingomonas azotifigens TaxID=330920 RepID=UPI001FEC28DD|nr:hypothetical protein [Sphingomonas azotifigens]
MPVTYHHLSPEHALPVLPAVPFRAVLVADQGVAPEWRNGIATWLAASGCLYFIAWGTDSEAWHDSVDWANLEAFNFGDIPDERFILTTWHDREPLSEVLWFAGHCARHPDVELRETVLLHLAPAPQAETLLIAFNAAQSSC